MKQQILIPALLSTLLGTSGIALAAESHDHGAMSATTTAAATTTIAATGTVKSVDAAKGKLMIDHEPIVALKWPRMTMDFQLADKAMAEKVQVGEKINFKLAPSEKKGGYVITAIEPAR
ncbi:MAG: copper-binding protein [Phycisphaerales bacterium]|nr:copper-binding protein [Phycisphaerales bacterium]